MGRRRTKKSRRSKGAKGGRPREGPLDGDGDDPNDAYRDAWKVAAVRSLPEWFVPALAAGESCAMVPLGATLLSLSPLVAVPAVSRALDMLLQSESSGGGDGNDKEDSSGLTAKERQTRRVLLEYICETVQNLPEKGGKSITSLDALQAQAAKDDEEGCDCDDDWRIVSQNAAAPYEATGVLCCRRRIDVYRLVETSSAFAYLLGVLADVGGGRSVDSDSADAPAADDPPLASLAACVLSAYAHRRDAADAIRSAAGRIVTHRPRVLDELRPEDDAPRCVLAALVLGLLRIPPENAVETSADGSRQQQQDQPDRIPWGDWYRRAAAARTARIESASEAEREDLAKERRLLGTACCVGRTDLLPLLLGLGVLARTDEPVAHGNMELLSANFGPGLCPRWHFPRKNVTPAMALEKDVLSCWKDDAFRLYWNLFEANQDRMADVRRPYLLGLLRKDNENILNGSQQESGGVWRVKATVGKILDAYHIEDAELERESGMLVSVPCDPADIAPDQLVPLREISEMDGIWWKRIGSELESRGLPDEQAALKQWLVQFAAK